MKSKRLSIAVLLYLIGLCLVLFFRARPDSTEFGLTLSEIQLICLPFIALACACLRLGSVSVPRSVIVLSFLLGFFATGFNQRVYTSDRTESYFLARLGADEYEAKTRIFREKVNEDKSVGQEVRLERHSDSVNTQREANQFLKDHPGTRAVVWGDQTWLRISFPWKKSESLTNLFHSSKVLKKIQAEKRGLEALELVLSVPVIGLPFNPEGFAAQYVAELLSALEHSQSGIALVDNLTSVAELDVKLPAMIFERWKHQGHRAYPLWFLANSYLAHVLHDRGEAGHLVCALQLYELALLYVRRDENPELRAAIANNLAVTQYLSAVLYKMPGGKKGAKTTLRGAEHTLTEENVYNMNYRAIKTVARNLKLLMAVPGKRS